MTLIRKVLLLIVCALAPGFVLLAPHPKDAFAQEVVPDTARQAADRASQLDALFKRLAQVTSENDAADVVAAIWGIWMETGDKDIDADMQLIVVAMNRQEFDSATFLLDKLVKKAPAYAEAWNKRATVHYIKKRYAASLADIDKTLELEPRHFGALSGRALVLTAQGDKKGALIAIEQALKVNPYLTGARSIIEQNGGTFQAREPI